MRLTMDRVTRDENAIRPTEDREERKLGLQIATGIAKHRTTNSSTLIQYNTYVYTYMFNNIYDINDQIYYIQQKLVQMQHNFLLPWKDKELL